jgi:predicted phosphodiesterase
VRVGLISDVHGNLLALEAVLAELERENVDSLVCLGDVAVGPQPAEALARVRELGCPVVLGNWDAAFLEGVPPGEDETSAIVNEIHAWWSEQLGSADRDYLQTFVPQLELDLGGVPALCYHGSPRSYDDWIFATTPDGELEPMFGPGHRPLLIGGHTHVQMLRRWDRATIVNPGSVGLPFLAWWPDRVRIAPWAEYAILTGEEGRLRVDLRRTTYDVEEHLRIARSSGMPHADWWIASWDLDGGR